MQSNAGYGQELRESFLWRWLVNNIRLTLFLVTAVAGMFLVYEYFSPETSPAEALTAVEAGQSLSAPIFKSAAARPISQRVSQSRRPTKVGVIAGHMGFDSGAVCDEDGLTEVEINRNIAERVVGRLQAAGIRAELLAEFDPRLNGYSATALISIHADSCAYINEMATGFKISGSPYTDSSALSICIEQAYRDATELNYHPNSITPDMTDYHAFRKIAPGTQALIIEVGFMRKDRDILTVEAYRPTEGLVNGIFCFLEGN
jgi:N-acetylmuramoyl-L-alanine amidase